MKAQLRAHAVLGNQAITAAGVVSTTIANLRKDIINAPEPKPLELPEQIDASMHEDMLDKVGRQSSSMLEALQEQVDQLEQILTEDVQKTMGNIKAHLQLTTSIASAAKVIGQNMDEFARAIPSVTHFAPRIVSAERAQDRADQQGLNGVAAALEDRSRSA